MELVAKAAVVASLLGIALLRAYGLARSHTLRRRLRAQRELPALVVIRAVLGVALYTMLAGWLFDAGWALATVLPLGAAAIVTGYRAPLRPRRSASANKMISAMFKPNPATRTPRTVAGTIPAANSQPFTIMLAAGLRMFPQSSPRSGAPTASRASQLMIPSTISRVPPSRAGTSISLGVVGHPLADNN
jgi:hypothetical protein